MSDTTSRLFQTCSKTASKSLEQRPTCQVVNSFKSCRSAPIGFTGPIDPKKASDNLDIIDESKKTRDDISEDRSLNYNSAFSRTIPKEYVERKSNSIEDAPVERHSFKMDHDEILKNHFEKSTTKY